MTFCTSTEKALHDEIVSFGSAHGLPVTTICRYALNDAGFVNRLKKGRSPSLVTVGKLRRWMRDFKRAADAEARQQS